MSVSILVVDDEPDVVELFRQRFRRETRQGTYFLHYATSGAEALDRIAGEIEPTLVATCPAWMGCNCSVRSSSASPICRS
jgi:CheY-like chemotaxis protein